MICFSKKTIFSLLLVGLLAGCGTNKSQRALSGGAIGAGVGTVGSVLTGGSPVAGAVIGGAAGALTGAMTSKKNLDLGRIK
ncbi:MAG: hypothetical protein ACOYK8_01040 [Alphaproteobacteria bacterium]